MTTNVFKDLAERNAFTVRSSDIGTEALCREDGKTYKAILPGTGATCWASLSDIPGSAALYQSMVGLRLTWLSTTTVSLAPGACPDSTNSVMLQLASSNTVNMATNGALGLDTGAIATAKVYYVWLLQGVSGTTVVASIQSGFASVTKPSGYSSYGRCVGTFHTKYNAATLPSFTQTGAGNRREYVETSSGGMLVAGTAATRTAVDMSAYLPKTAVTANGVVTMTGGAVTAVNPYMIWYLDAAGTIFVGQATCDSLANGRYFGFGEVVFRVNGSTPATALYYLVFNTSGTATPCSITLSGYVEEL